jgi:thiosulfate/3-mercaptopyruvate sulfurtransferase
MTSKRISVVAMALSFLSGGLLVVALFSIWRPAGSELPLLGDVHADQPSAKPPAPAAPWLKGTLDEKFAQIERHLRGLDQAMVEIGHRYNELLAAAKARNWEYAQYQTEKIDLSLRLAIERRPKRAKSSQPFLNESLPPVMEAIKAKNPERLEVALKGLHTGCIQCHRAENVLYMGQLFGTIQPTPPANAKAIEEYKKKLTPDSLRSVDRSNGRLVFSKHCANCHRLFGEGSESGGPDLTGLQRSNLDYLLTTIVDPNAMIGNDYQAVIVLTTKGRTITGLVLQDDQRNLTIQEATEKVTIPKDEIEQRSPSKVSFMPEGALQKLSDEEVRDLIGYLQGPDQAPLPPGKSDKDRKQSEARTMLIEPEELQRKLKEPRLRILDTRPPAEYAKGHVPGAVPVDVKSWQDLGKKEGGFRDAKAWGEKVGELGIDRDSHVVVYGSALTDTARIWWTLKYLGLANVSILNGGWDVWAKEKRPTDTATPKVVATTFEPRFDADRLEEIDSLKASLRSGKLKVVDTRSKDEFTGKEVRGPRGGHIPGAVHLGWKELLGKDGRFKTPTELQALFRSRGIVPDDAAACY